MELTRRFFIGGAAAFGALGGARVRPLRAGEAPAKKPNARPLRSVPKPPPALPPKRRNAKKPSVRTLRTTPK